MSYPPQTRPPLARILGGSPAPVLSRLILLSFVVGAMLVWIDVRPFDLVYGLGDVLHSIWRMGFGAVREAWDYFIVGAAVVFPIWLLMRLFGGKASQ